MIGILLITHGTFGDSLFQTVCHVLQRRPPLIAHLGISPCDAPAEITTSAKRLVSELDVGDGVLILTDMLGATPSNIAGHLLSPGEVEGVAGLNLPMLLRAITYRHDALVDVVDKVIAGGKDSVINLTRHLSDD